MIKESVHQEKTILHLYVPNNKALKYMVQKVTRINYLDVPFKMIIFM